MSDLSHRKSASRIRIVTTTGEGVANRKVKIRQTNHEFLFGCGAFEAVGYANFLGPEADPQALEDWIRHRPAGFPPVDTEAMQVRMDAWLDLFNYGTLPFYWGQFERKEGHPQTEDLMKATRFLTSKGVISKGHNLFWQTVGADWLLKYDTDTIFRKAVERAHREVRDFNGMIDLWDVINEVCIMPEYDKYDNAATRVCQKYGRVPLVKALFEAAKAENPNSNLLINDYELSPRYESLIGEYLEAGVPLDTIGLQSHQHHGVWGREKLEEVLDRFEHFGLPIHFTENTIVAGPPVSPDIHDLQDAHYDDDAATPELEEMQAEELEKMYRLLFEEHPQITAITNWDFGDGAWLNAPSGFLRKDNSKKPSYFRLQKLIKEEWHTEAELVTDDHGFVVVNGFKGTYELVCEAGSGAFRLCESIPEQTLVVTK